MGKKTLNRNKKENQIKTAREKLMLLEAANNYCDYINYKRIIPTEHTTEVFVNKEAFKAALERAML